MLRSNVSFLVIFICGCSGIDSSKKEIIDSTFEYKNLSFYKNFDEALRISNDSTSEFYFQNILKIFESNQPKLDESSSIALFYGGLTHSGYQSEKVEELEAKSEHFNQIQKPLMALEAANEALQIFPLSVKAHFEKLTAFSLMKETDSLSLAAAKVNVLFSGMSLNGYGINEDLDKFSIAFSKNDINEYISKYAAIGNYKLKNEKLDKYGNSIIVYESGIDFMKFVIPNKNWVNKR